MERAREDAADGGDGASPLPAPTQPDRSPSPVEPAGSPLAGLPTGETTPGPEGSRESGTRVSRGERVRIDVERRIWVVTDPGPRSEFGDICFRANLAGLALQVKGGLDVEGQHTCIYLAEADARADAQARLAARALYDTTLRGVRP